MLYFAEGESDAQPKPEEGNEEQIKEEEKTDEDKPLPKRGRQKPKRYLTPESEPAPRRAKMKAMFKDLDDEAPPAKEAQTPGKGRGRPKKSVDTDQEEGTGKKGQTKGKGKTPGRKPKKDVEEVGGTKNTKLLKEFDAELAEINGTTSRRRTNTSANAAATAPPDTPATAAAVRKQSSRGSLSKSASPPPEGSRPALEGFEPDSNEEEEEDEEEMLASETSDREGMLVEPPEFGEEPHVRRSVRSGRKITVPAMLLEADSPDEDATPYRTTGRRQKRQTPKPRPRFERKPRGGGAGMRKRRSSRAITDDEGEGIPIDSLEGAINSASSLLADQSDSSGEAEQPPEVTPQPVVPSKPKVSRSGRNVRSPRRPMENDFETDFSTLRRAMNATTADFGNKRRKVHSGFDPDLDYSRFEQQPHQQPSGYNALNFDYFDPPATTIGPGIGTHRFSSETSRTRTFEENQMEKTLSMIDPNTQLLNSAANQREPLLLETHLRAAAAAAAEPPTILAAPKRQQRKSTSQTDVKTPSEKVYYRKQRPGFRQQMGERSLLKQVRMDSGTDSGDHMDALSMRSSLTSSHRDGRDMLSEMVRPPTHPIVPADDHNYSLSSRFMGDAAANAAEATGSSQDEANGGADAMLAGQSSEQTDMIDQISIPSSLLAVSSGSSGLPVAVTSGTPALATFSEGITVPISSVSGVPSDSALPPKEVVIYINDKRTLLPVMQDPSGMSVITLPNGMAPEDLRNIGVGAVVN